MSIHIIKLVVGTESLEEFARWQTQDRVTFQGQEANIVRTRYMPKKADDILKTEGSIYRVIKNRIVCRQRIIGFDRYESHDKGTQSLIITETQIIQTQTMPYRPFQGWRYLDPAKAPSDRGFYILGQQNDQPPPEMEDDLKQAGLL